MWGIVFGRSQHSPVNGCSGACWNFGVLALEDELLLCHLNTVLGCSLKNNRMISVHFQGKPFCISNPSLSPDQNYQRSWSWMFLWRCKRPSRTNTKKRKKRERERCPFHHRGLECKSRKSRDTWSNRQVWPWSTKWNRAKKVLPRECTCHSKHPLPTAQATTLHMDITRWSTLKSDWLYSLQPKMSRSSI